MLIRSIRWLEGLTSPAIYSCVLPFLLLDTAVRSAESTGARSAGYSNVMVISEERLHSADQRTAIRYILNRIGKSKTEVPI